MNNNQILNTIETFTRSIRLQINILREIKSKYKNNPENILDVWTDIGHVKLSFRFDSDEIMNRQGFIDLPITGHFCEISDIIENLDIRADEALDDSKRGNYSDYLFEWLDDAIERLPKICDELNEYVKNERTEQLSNVPGTLPDKQTHMESKEQPWNENDTAYMKNSQAIAELSKEKCPSLN
jgi:hypothetical protein